MMRASRIMRQPGKEKFQLAFSGQANMTIRNEGLFSSTGMNLPQRKDLKALSKHSTELTTVQKNALRKVHTLKSEDRAVEAKDFLCLHLGLNDKESDAYLAHESLPPEDTFNTWRDEFRGEILQQH